MVSFHIFLDTLKLKIVAFAVVKLAEFVFSIFHVCFVRFF